MYKKLVQLHIDINIYLGNKNIKKFSQASPINKLQVLTYAEMSN